MKQAKQYYAKCLHESCNGLMANGKECGHHLLHAFDETECCHITCGALPKPIKCAIVSTVDGGRTFQFEKNT